jgi:hypothetical protein
MFHQIPITEVSSMMSMEVARQMAREQAEQSALEGKEPYFMMDWDIEELRKGIDECVRSFPNLGTYCPDNWKRVNLEDDLHLSGQGIYMGDNDGYGAFFVDSTGWGSASEPAMSLEELIRHVITIGKGYGYALVEVGEMQVKVGVFAQT